MNSSEIKTPMRSPRFSICIPNFNYSQYIDKTLLSVLSQSYNNFEIIVSDNASTDNSVEVVQSFRDSRIRLVQNSYNIGFAPNLDKVTEASSGDYLILLSSDDIMKQGALAEYAAILSSLSEPCQELVLCSGIDVIDEHGRVLDVKEGLSPELRATMIGRGVTADARSNQDLEIYRGNDLFRAAMEGTFTNVGKFLSTCYSRPLFERVGGYRSVMSVIPDAHFSHKIMQQNPHVVFIRRSLFQYRVHAAGNYAQRYDNIRLHCDVYLMTQLYSDRELAHVGLSRHQIQLNFVNRFCARGAAMGLITGRGGFALRAYFLGWAAYPGLMSRQWLGWCVPFLALAYPVCYAVFGLYSKLKRKRAAPPCSPPGHWKR